MSPHEAFIALNMLPRIGPVRVRRLLDLLESPENILDADPKDLTQVQGIGKETARIIHQWRNHIDVDREIKEAQQRNLTVLTQDSPDYPSHLHHMYDPPLALYVWGEIKPADKHAVAIVGSRKTTHYGQNCATDIAKQLATAGLTIVSGLARGIDSFAHQGALQADARTIAVIGSGLAQLYPPENYTLAQHIADGHGAIVSEFPLHQKPDKKTFPMRNRIVAAWSTGILVVECPKWSGSMITANLGLEMGKTVYAVPGPIDRPTSAGCNQLIRDGATLVTSATDILDDLHTLPLNFNLEVQPEHSPLPELTPLEHQVLASLSKEERLMDDILSTTQLSVPETMSTLLKLEMKRLIRQLPGPRFVLR